jgi:hypothetical protein
LAVFQLRKAGSLTRLPLATIPDLNEGVCDARGAHANHAKTIAPATEASAELLVTRDPLTVRAACSNNPVLHVETFERAA